MPRVTSDNISEWRKLSEIDYFSQFIKAWLTVNASLSHRYPNIKGDRGKINELKKDSQIKDKIIYFLDGLGDIEKKNFRLYISTLHSELENNIIYDDKESGISYRAVLIEENTIMTSTENYNGFEATATKNIDSSIDTKITNRAGNEIFSEHQNRFNISEIEEKEIVNENAKNLLLKAYENINPWKKDSVISEGRSGYDMEGIYFIDNKGKIAKATIEVIYLLRCALFHASIVPTPEINKVYEQAFFILKFLIKDL